MITPSVDIVVAGRYQLVRPLASGGMGSVWVARHRELDVDVTVKFMAPSLVASAEARTRFEREARVAARLRSQHVVQVFDYGVAADTPYIVMELLEGESLADRLARERRLPIPATAQLVVQTCKALRTAHDAGLVHRDLKPGNIFVARKDGDEVVKVLDFGIAKAGGLGEAGAGTETGVLLGSAHYMSPEQIRSSRTVDHRSDLWSLGIILYRVLVGRLPFPGKEVGDIIVRVCSDPIPVPSSIAPHLTAEVDAFFKRALDRDPDLRFQTAAEMVEAFCALGLGAAQPSTRAPQPRWTKTLPLDSPPLVPPSSATSAAVVQESPATQKISDAVPESASVVDRATNSSAAEEPTIAVAPVSEAPTGSLPVVLAPDRERVRSAKSVRPPNSLRARVRALWPLWVALLAMFAFGLQRRMTVLAAPPAQVSPTTSASSSATGKPGQPPRPEATSTGTSVSPAATVPDAGTELNQAKTTPSTTKPPRPPTFLDDPYREDEPSRAPNRVFDTPSQ